MNNFSKFLLSLICSIVLLANSIGALHQLHEFNEQQDIHVECHNTHYESHHHHCDLDGISFDFFKQNQLELFFVQIFIHTNKTLANYNRYKSVIHYLFNTKSPPYYNFNC